MRLKDISLSNRPRERLVSHGVSSLSDAELLAIILVKGSFNENVVDMCNRLISKYTLDKLSNCCISELQEIKGIGLAKACQIISIFELSNRYKVSKITSRSIRSSKAVFDYLSPSMSPLQKEHFVVLLLDSKNKIIKKEIISIGTLNSTLIHPREIFRSAIRENANSIILAHNHPSGDPTPSDDDCKITSRLKEVGELLDIKVLDHVIIGGDKWYSFDDEGVV